MEKKEIKDKGYKLIRMDEVEVEEVSYLWFPYIPFGKTTIVQGDPGDGKTTMVLAIAAAVTTNKPLPENDTAIEPMNVIFQTAEDGLGDTIKPRLLQAGADCSRVIVIDESVRELSLSDARIEKAIVETGAKLFIIDPLSAYLGSTVDMHRANEVRPVMKRISLIAEKTGCAIVIIGHLNKSMNKSQYRGLGSIDIYAAARSVLTVGRIKGKPYLRAFAQGKSNLAPEGKSIAFELDPATGFRWVGVHPITIDELLSGILDKETALQLAMDFLKTEIKNEEVLADKIFEMADAQNISERTLNRAKAKLGIRSLRKNSKWYWGMDLTQKQDCQQINLDGLATLNPNSKNGGIKGKNDVQKE